MEATPMAFSLSTYRVRGEVYTTGSGSLEQDGSLSMVAMEEEEQACLMHQHRLGKG